MSFTPVLYYNIKDSLDELDIFVKIQATYIYSKPGYIKNIIVKYHKDHNLDSFLAVV